MPSHKDVLQELIDFHKEEEIKFKTEIEENPPTSTNSDEFTDIKDSDEEQDEPSKPRAAPKAKAASASVSSTKPSALGPVWSGGNEAGSKKQKATPVSSGPTSSFILANRVIVW